MTADPSPRFSLTINLAEFYGTPDAKDTITLQAVPIDGMERLLRARAFIWVHHENDGRR